MTIKSKPILSLLICSLSLFSGCFILQDVAGPEYAELRLDDDGRRQLLIVSDNWLAVLPADGHGPGGPQHGVSEWFFLQGDGPVFTNPIMQPNHRPFTPSPGTIIIDLDHKKVKINLYPNLNPAFYLNGEYQLRLVSHDPFYRPDTAN